MQPSFKLTLYISKKKMYELSVFNIVDIRRRYYIYCVVF